jgi:hypothetical protein
MSAYAFLVRGRSTDLVAMTAAQSLRSHFAHEGELVSLMRDDVHLLEGVEGSDPGQWTDACTSHAHWFNPNKHRFALVEAAPGGISAARRAVAWPTPWLKMRLHTDRPDILASGEPRDALSEWLAQSETPGTTAVSLAVWEHDESGGTLPAGRWPRPEAQYLHLVLWTLVLRSGDVAAGIARAEELAITRHRRHGVLVHPHMQGWARVAPAVAHQPIGG